MAVFREVVGDPVGLEVRSFRSGHRTPCSLDDSEEAVPGFRRCGSHGKSHREGTRGHVMVRRVFIRKMSLSQRGGCEERLWAQVISWSPNGAPCFRLPHNSLFSGRSWGIF